MPIRVTLCLCHLCKVESSSGVVWSPSLVLLVLGPLGQRSCAGLCQIFCVPSPGLPTWSYHTIHSLLLCLIGLSVWGRGRLCTRVCFLQLWARSKFKKKVVLYLLATPPPLELSQSFSRILWRKTVGCTQDGCTPLTLLHGSFGRVGSPGMQDGASGSPTWGQHG